MLCQMGTWGKWYSEQIGPQYDWLMSLSADGSFGSAIISSKFSGLLTSPVDERIVGERVLPL